MKLLFTVLMLAGTFVSNAQNHDYENYLKSNASIDFKAEVYQSLELNETELRKFDPLFEKFIEEDGSLAMERLIIFEAYANRLDTYSEDQFDQFNKNLFKNELAVAKNNKKYYKKFSKTIGIEKTTKFFFVKKFINNTIEGAKLKFLDQ